MFQSQASSWSAAFFSGGYDAVPAPFDLQAQAEANPTRIILVGPRYFLPYGESGVQFPGIHLTNEGYRRLGEYYGKVYKQVVVDGGAWSPLKPASITRSGAVITATFDVPVAPHVLDTALVSNPGNFGFEFHDDSGAPPAIASVATAGPATLTITLAATPTGGNKRLRYAYTGIIGNGAGPTSGPRGNLRDSDATVSPSGAALPNWCVHFDKPVN
jgi:hypothetical protein